MTRTDDENETYEARLLEGAGEAADMFEGLRALGGEVPREVLDAAADQAVPALLGWAKARAGGALAFAEAAAVEDGRAVDMVRGLVGLVEDPALVAATNTWARAVLAIWFERLGFTLGATPPPAAQPAIPTFPRLDAVVRAYLSNQVHGAAGVLAPEIELGAALRELEEAIAWDAGAKDRARAAGETTRKVPVRPTPAILAAAIACRDGYAVRVGGDGAISTDVEPVVALVDPEDPDRVRALVIVSMTREAFEQRVGP